MKHRNEVIDIIKGIAIILVVFGHIIKSNVNIGVININNLLYIFHMPLFFMVAGYLIKYEKNKEVLPSIRKKFKTIILPYFIFSLLCFFYWFFVERKIRNQMSVSVMSVFQNIFLCRIDEQLLCPNIVLWFLPCLFLTEVIYMFLRRINNNFFIFFLVEFLFILGVILCYYQIILPFGIETALIAIQFIYIGNKVGEYEERIKKYKYFIIPFCFFMYIIALIYNGNVSMLGHNYGIIPLFILGAIGGTGIIYLISKILTRFKFSKIIKYYGINSLLVMLCHDPIKRIISKVISMMIRVSDETIRSTIWGSLLILFFVLVVMIPIIRIINSYFPFLIGKNKEIKKTS